METTVTRTGNNAAKKDARSRAAADGIPYTEARTRINVQTQQPDVVVVQFAAPDLNGIAPCSTCSGSGLGPDQYEQPTGSGPVLLVDTACPTCKGCGRADHEGCLPGAHADDDPDEISDHLAELDDESDEWDERCPSCQGVGFNWTQGVTDDPAHQQALDDLMERARARGMSDWDVQGAAAFGQLDDVLGEGSTSVFTGGVVYLRMACGCQTDRARTIPRQQFDLDAPEEGQR